MPDDQVVLVDDEDVPLAVDAPLPVVVGEGGVESLGLVAADGVVDEEPGVVGGADFGGMEATTPRAIRSASAEVSPGCDVGVETMAASTIRSTSSWDSPASGRGVSAIALRIASSTSAEVSPGSLWTGAGASANSSRTISSTSGRNSLPSPSPQAMDSSGASRKRIALTPE